MQELWHILIIFDVAFGKVIELLFVVLIPSFDRKVFKSRPGTL